MNRKYIGRFAPSPTGPLHFGSLVAAVASYLDAKAHGGEWIVRMEDVDEPRCVSGADRVILQTLRDYGFEFAEPVMCQSRRKQAYRAALDRLVAMGAAYPCSCSRKDVGDGAYPGTCRSGIRDALKPVSWRVKTDDADGDFVVLRSDGLFAYQLAVVVDDAEQGVTDVVRGADLLDSTPRQQHLQRLLGYPTPRYLHVPVVVNEAGEKLSKQTLAPGLDAVNAVRDLGEALRFLGQGVPESGIPAEILRLAAERWNGRG